MKRRSHFLDETEGVVINRRTLLKGTGLAVLAASCFGRSASAEDAKGAAKPIWFAPKAPPFPLGNAQTVSENAQKLSDALLSHIHAWMDGKAPAELPKEVLPRGYNPRLTRFRLVKPEEVTADRQWARRLAETINLDAVRGYFPDPHCSYFVLPHFYAPFGCKAILTGEFPHCRFFSLQPTPAFDPLVYRYDGATGVGEVPLVDVDIRPLKGHENPFLPGANRNAKKRGYQVTFEFSKGNPVKLEPAFRPPYYRAPGNTRRVGGLVYQGPWGEGSPGHGRGPWDFGQIWMRYYAPDDAAGPLGGVPLPKVHYELPDGRKFFIDCDFSRWEAVANRHKKARNTWPEEPLGDLLGSAVGWVKQFGIFRVIVEGVVRNTKWADEAYVRALDEGVAARGEDIPPPGNFEPSATSCTHINYLLRGMSLGWGKVAVLVGRLPTTPKTRSGQSKMQRAQARYWSITGYDNGMPDSDGFSGAAIHSIMDEAIKTDKERRYIMVFSRAADRPANATLENGVTWVEWGTLGRLSWTIRWLSVHPDWSFSLTPHEHNLGWETDWAATTYDPSLIGENNHKGWLKDYLPRVHYLKKSEFEALGSSVTQEKLPKWV